MNIYKFITLILITIFYISYFMKQMILKKRGIQTNRLAKGDKARRTFLIELLLLITTYTMAVIQYASVLLGEYTIIISVTDSFKILGIVTIFIGNMFFICAIITMQDSWRAGVDKTQNTDLIKIGIYSISRNPAFVGFDLLYIGTALAFSNIFSIVGTIITIVILHMQILEEEKFLPSVFGQEYIEYKKKTNRYFLYYIVI